MNKIMTGLNGKKLPIGIIITLGISYGALQAQVAGNSAQVKELKPNTTQIARLEENIESLGENVEKLEVRQEKRFDKLESKIDRIVEAVTP